MGRFSELLAAKVGPDVDAVVERSRRPLGDGDESDEGEEELKTKLWKDFKISVGSDTSPMEGRSGAVYEVIHEQVPIRPAPSFAAPPQQRRKQGEKVEMFEWDATREWRKVVDQQGRIGWMKLDSSTEGPLLRPHCIPFQKQPLSPVCAAALEGDVSHLRSFLDEGMDANATDVGGQTALMLASSRSHVGCIVLLVERGAELLHVDGLGQTALELAGSEPARALLQALALQPHSTRRLVEAKEQLDADLAHIAERLLGVQQGRRSDCKRYQVVSKRAIIRSEAMKESNIVGMKSMGEIVTALDHDGDWIKLDCPYWTKKDGQQNYAWMLTKHEEQALLEELV